MKRWTVASIVLLPVASCSVDTPEPDHTAFAICEEIAVACHNVDLDEDGGIGEDCHAVGHLAKSEVPCQRERAVCMAYCGKDGGFDANDWVDSGSRIIEIFLDSGADVTDGGTDQ